MTTNERLKEIMLDCGLDIRPDPALNKDADLIAKTIKASRHSVLSWLKPETWKSHRKMPDTALALLEMKKKGLKKKAG